ncbi:MAG: P1 family peptidase [bacterium]|nr:P1 family peptidase [bacterium]
MSRLIRSICPFLCILLLSVTLHARPRARELGIQIGFFPPGPNNAITDVEGVLVGHVTLNWGSGKLVVGQGPVRTGVTAIRPHGDDIFDNLVFAAAVALNGNGAMTNMEWINERGLLEVPIILTNTLSVGTAYDGVVAYMLKKDLRRVPLPVVAECWDGELNDIAGRHVKEEHVIQAIEKARGGPVPEGSVGAGTGMRMAGFKAGIGTASRILPEANGGYTVGVLVNANIGPRYQLIFDGVSVLQELQSPSPPSSSTRDGSIIVVIATDAPLIPIQLRRLCKRAAMGISRVGAVSHAGSGDFAIAFSTAQRISTSSQLAPSAQGRRKGVDTVETVRDGYITPLFRAVIEATEEAVINSLCVADTIVGRDDRVKPGIPHDRLVEILKRHGRIK